MATKISTLRFTSPLTATGDEITEAQRLEREAKADQEKTVSVRKPKRIKPGRKGGAPSGGRKVGKRENNVRPTDAETAAALANIRAEPANEERIETVFSIVERDMSVGTTTQLNLAEEYRYFKSLDANGRERQIRRALDKASEHCKAKGKVLKPRDFLEFSPNGVLLTDRQAWLRAFYSRMSIMQPEQADCLDIVKGHQSRAGRRLSSALAFATKTEKAEAADLKIKADARDGKTSTVQDPDNDEETETATVAAKPDKTARLKRPTTNTLMARRIYHQAQGKTWLLDDGLTLLASTVVRACLLECGIWDTEEILDKVLADPYPSE